MFAMEKTIMVDGLFDGWVDDLKNFQGKRTAINKVCSKE